MARQIAADTLREWLDARRPVTVLDIRTDEARAQWSIPGSVHVNAYDDLREGRPGALSTLGSDVLILPAHASEPIAFDGHPISALMHDVAMWLSEWLSSEDAFIDRVMSRLPATPPNFARIVELNEAGELPAGDPTELEAGANRCAVA